MNRLALLAALLPALAAAQPSAELPRWERQVVRLSADAVAALADLPTLRAAVVVEGRRARPRAGFAFYVLPRRAGVLVSEDVGETVAVASETIPRVVTDALGNAILVTISCGCLSKDGDACRFERDARGEPVIGRCGGETCCRETLEGLVLGTGAAVVAGG
ncbi:hypothetical protein [Rubrivirga marina]|uniref:Rieske domain-containing protein n=1 Tax=Rubrivirga marina TaxID=1196024 RepID=A0A271J1Q4_9BACT|nr:hypothetical protein [Rubrivirga marina]PAP77237.1 hypothetical protein BSZ37_12740 [Rubrivirga marina]